jgi:FKBP-type peptidyl-prolyl cis-trans isomerase FkpA
MKRILFTLLLLCIVGFIACRKSGTQPDIKQYDQQQIQAYIAANNITGMQTDPTDTTGTYYQRINPGNPLYPVDYPSRVAYVYSLRSFDGKYLSIDTVLNHFDGYLGHVAPSGLMLALRNILKYKGAQARLLIPSHMAYGVSGVGSGSKTVTNSSIAGNQCLDYTINLIQDQDVYDDLVIKKYMATYGLTGYSEITSGTGAGMWYKINAAGSGASINDNSSVAANYSLRLMNNSYVDSTYATTAYTFSDLKTLTTGFYVGLKMVKNAGNISLLVPSRLGYGEAGSSGIPSDACLRFEIYNIVVTNY